MYEEGRKAEERKIHVDHLKPYVGVRSRENEIEGRALHMGDSELLAKLRD